jgi:hypothetical protein
MQSTPQVENQAAANHRNGEKSDDTHKGKEMLLQEIKSIIKQKVQQYCRMTFNFICKVRNCLLHVM